MLGGGAASIGFGLWMAMCAIMFLLSSVPEAGRTLQMPRQETLDPRTAVPLPISEGDETPLGGEGKTV
jgi:hypothetical protein